MIKFFRKIRQQLLTENKVNRYLLYAIGEIVLVVIGILIALQINNWNEERNHRITEAIKLTKLLDDLKQDAISFDKNLKELSSIDNLHKQLYTIGFKGENETLTENPNDVRKHIFYNPVSEKNAALLVTQLNNEIIRNQLTYYLDRLERNNIVNNEFSIVIKDRIRLFLANNGVYNLTSQFEETDKANVNLIRNNDLIALSKTADFQQLLFEANLKLKNLELGLNELIYENGIMRNVIIDELKTY